MDDLQDLLIAYILGAFRDGSIRKHERNYEITIWQKDRRWLETIQGIIFLTFHRKTEISKTRDGFRIRFRSKEIYNFFIENGLPTSGNQSFWETPTFVTVSPKRKKFYIAGFFDAEGCVGTYWKGPSRYVRLDFYHSWNNSKECPPLRDIKNFLEELDIRCGEVRLRKGFINYPRFVLSISNLPSVHRFAQYIPILHPVKRLRLAVALA